MTRVAFDMKEPCASCPYRRDAPLQLWAREEFVRLLETDAEPFPGALYACHGTGKLPQKRVCGGWLLDQKRRGCPSIALRLSLLSDDTAVVCLETITDGGHPLYDSIEDMVDANFPELLHGQTNNRREKRRGLRKKR
jgi:hypothetical protein